MQKKTYINVLFGWLVFVSEWKLQLEFEDSKAALKSSDQKLKSHKKHSKTLFLSGIELRIPHLTLIPYASHIISEVKCQEFFIMLKCISCGCFPEPNPRNCC